MLTRSLSVSLVLSLTLLACDGGGGKGSGDDGTTTNGGGGDGGDDGGTTGAVDADGDGFDSNADCDDSNADVNPEAAEICDGIDNDCDTLIDDADDSVDTSTGSIFYADGDGDGFGDADQAIAACAQPSSTVDNGDDCDDGNAGVNPEAIEVCDPDDVDEDCSGAADDADAGIDPSTQTLFYPDGDGDGFGDETDAGVLLCDPPSDMVSDNTDCDDGVFDVHPDATEVCDDADIDEDCSGAADDADAGVDPSTQTLYYPDGDGDGFGDETDAGVLLCEQPSGTVADNSDCDDEEGEINPDATEVCDGIDNDCDLTTSEAGTASFVGTSGTLTDVTSDFTGTSSAPASVTWSRAGDLTFCDGTWYTNLTVSADVHVTSQTGDPATTILDGAGSGTVLNFDTDGSVASVSNLTLQNGAGGISPYFYVSAGGAMMCEPSSTTTDIELTLDNVVMDSSSADYGGGLWAFFCNITATDLTITNNEADAAAGGYVFVSDLELEGGEVSNNVAATSVGGLLVASGTLTATDLELSSNEAAGDFGALYLDSTAATLDDVWVEGNTAATFAGAYISSSDVVWTGTSATSSGLSGNSDSDGTGALYIGSSSTVEFDVVDFGASGSTDDNGTWDLEVESGQVYVAGDDASFSCDDSGCGTPDTSSIASTVSGTSSGAWFLGNIVVPSTSGGTIESFAPYTRLYDTDCTLDYYVLSASSSSATTWDVEWASTEIASDTTFEAKESPPVGMVVDSSKVYALAWSSANCSIEYSYEITSTAQTVSGMGSTLGYVYQYSTAGGPYVVGDSITMSTYDENIFTMDVDITTL